jgi:flagellin
LLFGDHVVADIPITAQTRTTLVALSQARTLIDASSKRITTGLRVSSPFDGVAAFFDAQELSTRTVNLLEAKERLTNAAVITGGTVTSLDEIISLLNTAKSLVTAAKGGAVSGVVSTTSSGNVVSTVGADVTDTIGGAVDGDTFKIVHDGTTTVITNSANSTFTSIVAQISAISGITASVSDGNAIVITAADGNDINVIDDTNNLGTDLGLASSTNGTVATNTTRSSAETQFDLIRTKITTLVGAASFLGTNLISSSPDDLIVALNEDHGDELTVSGVATSSSDLSLTAVDELGSFATDGGIETTIAEIDAALTTVNTTKSAINTDSSIINSRLDFIDGLTELIDEGIYKLTGTDLDEEAANLLALQTRHDLSVTSVGLFFKEGTVLTTLLQLGK